MAEKLGSLVHDLPEAVARVLEDFVAASRTAFGADLDAVVLYGSAAEAALRSTSDVNVILVLSAFDQAKADRLREPFETAHAAVRLGVMFLLREEIPAAAEAFAQKFADVLRRRRVLYGDDPFASVAVPRSALVTRLNQVLLNLTLRLRAWYVERSLREEQLVRVIAETAAPLRTSAASLLELEGQRPASPKEALRSLVSQLPDEGWDAVTGRLSEAREGRMPPEVASETVMRLIELTRLMRARARQLR